MKLNEMTPGLEQKIAPTDCRLRPDQHYMEVGEFDKVSNLMPTRKSACATPVDWACTCTPDYTLISSHILENAFEGVRGPFQWFCLQANAEKLRLETKQRAARKAAEEGVPLEPRWFERVPGARYTTYIQFCLCDLPASIVNLHFPQACVKVGTLAQRDGQTEKKGSMPTMMPQFVWLPCHIRLSTVKSAIFSSVYPILCLRHPAQSTPSQSSGIRRRSAAIICRRMSPNWIV